MSTRQIIVGIGLAISLGCVPHTEPPATTAPAATPAAAEKTPLPTNPPLDPVAAASAATEPVVPPQENTSTPTTDAAPINQTPDTTPAENSTQQVEAKAGVGKQGQSLKNESGIMVEAAKAYFNVRQRAVFEIQIPEAIKLFEATEGRKPKSHEEFMAKIIQANSIKLPTLPANNRYVYDVERGELMVEKSAK